MPPIGNKIKLQENRSLLENPRVKAMLNTIAYAEGADYNTRVGGGTFGDLSKKPGKKTYIKSIGDYSTAEGRYQFLNSTWDSVAKDLGLSDFSPQSQDLAAVELIKRRGALDDVLKGDLKSATTKLSKEWASLPTKSGGSAYRGQRARSMQSLAKVFAGNGGGSTYTSQPHGSYDASTYVPEYINLSERIIGNVPSTTEDTKEEAEAKQSIDKVTQEQQMLQNYFAQDAQAVAESYPQQQEQIQAYEAPSIGEQYSTVSHFVDTPIAQEGGIKESPEEIEKQRAFTANWYDNRVVEGKYIPKGMADVLSKVSVEAGALPENQYGEYDPLYGTVTLDTKKTNRMGIPAHEFDHSVGEYNKRVNRDFYKNYISDPIEKIIPQTGDYFRDKDEIRSEIMRLRYNQGYKPDQVITREDLDKVENFGDYNLPFSTEDRLEFLNKTAAVDRGEKRYYSQEGGIPVSSQGVYDFPMQEVLVPTSNGEITMKDVDYPILGIDEFGNKKMMHPGKNYKFPGKRIHEIPDLKNYFNKRN